MDPRRDDLASLGTRLGQVAAEVLEPAGIAWRVSVPDGAERLRLHPERRRHLYLLLKEAVTNAARHSGARERALYTERWASRIGTMTARPIEIAVVEDDEELRESLRLLVDGAPGFSCRGAYGSAEEALAALAGRAPDVFLLDIRLPGETGSRAVRRFVDLLKKTPPDRLLEAAREAFEGGAPMSPEIGRKVVRLFRTIPAPRSEPSTTLSPQGLRFLGLLAEGYSYQSAAGSLCVSINTVRNYVRGIYEKLHVHSRSEAVGKALRSGLI